MQSLFIKCASCPSLNYLPCAQILGETRLSSLKPLRNGSYFHVKDTTDHGTWQELGKDKGAGCMARPSLLLTPDLQLNPQ